MNKILTKVATLALGAAMAVGVGIAVGHRSVGEALAGEETVTFSNVYSADTTLSTYSGSSFSITFNKNTSSNAPKYFKNGSNVRMYSNTSLTVSSTNTLTSISFTNTSGYDGTVTASVGTYSSATWSGSASSVELTNTASSQWRFTSMTVVTSGGVVTNYTITYDSNGGTGTMENTVGANPAVADCTFTAPEGMRFKEWNDSASGSGASYTVGATPGKDLDLFAIWETKPEGLLIDKDTLEMNNPSASSGYAKYDGDHAFDNVTVNTLDVMVNGEVLQVKKNTGWLHNKTSGGVIKSITLASTENFTIYAGSSVFESRPSSGTAVTNGSDISSSGYEYFAIVSGSNAASTSSILIEFVNVDPQQETLVVKANGSETSPVEMNYSIGSSLFRAYDENDEDVTKSCEWSISDSSIATLALNSDNIPYVSFVKPGQVTITASKSGYNNGLFVLTINGGVLSSITVGGSMTKTSYTTAENWSPDGLTVTANYAYGYSEVVTSDITWTYSPEKPADGVKSVVANATYGGKSAASSAQSVSVEVVLEPIVLDKDNWPATSSYSSDVATHDADGITYENVRAYIYQSKYLALRYNVNSYFGNKTPFSRNIKSIVIEYVSNVTSYVSMYEGSEPLAKTTKITGVGTTSVTYTFSDTTPYFRLNMDTSTPNGTYCNISSITITLGSAAQVIDLEDISLNGNASNPVGCEFKSSLTLSPSNANNKDTIAWDSSNKSVATVDANGVVTCLSVGSTTISATATDLVGVSKSYTLTVFNATPIEKIYYMSSGASVDFNAVYVGFSTGTGPIFMNGEYGIVVYDSSKDVSSWTENETIVNVKGTLDIYSGLYEVKSATYEVLESASDVATPVTYTVVGGESQLYESRKTYVPGTVVSVSGGWTADTTVVMNVGGTEVQCFAKANAIDSETGAKIAAGETVTLEGFTSWHNGFQVTITGLLEQSESYTASDFAQDLIDLTDAVCVNYQDGVSSWQEFHDEFVSIWNTLNSADKYQSLSQDERDILVDADREGSDIVSRAMFRYDFLTGKYQLNNFITGRTPITSNGALVFETSSVDSSSSIAIIVIVAVASMTLLGTTLVIRKRKHQ